MNSIPNSLLSEVESTLRCGSCVGCGACSVASGGSIDFVHSPDGSYVAHIADKEIASRLPSGICPFSNTAPNEDEHGLRLFSNELEHDSNLGYFRSTWAGYVERGNLRGHGSSGGITSWFIAEALRQGEINAVIHVHAKNEGALFEYRISRTVDDVISGAKTRYYSVNFADAISQVRKEGLKFALVGVPCFIKAARNLAASDSELNSQFILAVSLVCGHMKSPGFAESLAWQVGVPPTKVGSVDFRVKIPDRPANQYGFSATHTETGVVHTAPMAKMAGRRWDGGYHRLQACDYCDDVFGETADITFGDAWLPEFSQDSQGTNVVVVRSTLAEKIIQKGKQSGELTLIELEKSQAIATQSGGLRDRRQGLAYRLHLDEKKRKPHPQKRIKASSEGLTPFRKLNYRLRRIVRVRSAANLRFCKRIGTISPYRLEMTFWHGCFRLLQITEKRLSFLLA